MDVPPEGIVCPQAPLRRPCAPHPSRSTSLPLLQPFRLEGEAAAHQLQEILNASELQAC